MNICQIRPARVLVIVLLGCAWSVGVFAQGARADFRLKGLRQQLADAPSGGGADLGGHPATLYRKWLKIEAHFESTPEWADDVQVKFYVLLGKGRETRMFVGDVTHINVAKGTQHYSALFMHPNTIKRWSAGGGPAEAVAVVLFYKGQPVSFLSEPHSTKRWWEEFTPVPSYLLTPMQTPWAILAPERWEAQKPAAATTP